jgi:chitinase
MSYDLHGTWDADSQFVGPNIAPHTNLTEIDLGLGLLWRAGVAASKVVLGQGWVSLCAPNSCDFSTKR